MIADITNEVSLKDMIDNLIKKEADLDELTDEIVRLIHAIRDINKVKRDVSKFNQFEFIQDAETKSESEVKKMIETKEELKRQLETLKAEYAVNVDYDDILIELEKLQVEFKAKFEVSFKYRTVDRMTECINSEDIKKIFELLQNNNLNDDDLFAELKENKFIEKSIHIYDIERI